MKKKILALVLTGACLMSMTACADSTATNEKATENNTENNTEDTEEQAAYDENAEVLSVEADSTVNVNGQELSYSTVWPEGEDVSEAYVKLSYDSQEIELSDDMYEWLGNAFVIVDSEDSFRVIAIGSGSNDWNTSILIKYDKEKGFTKCAEADGYAESTDEVTGTTIVLHSRADVFGTIATAINYDISADTFEQTDDIVLFDNNVTNPDGDFFSEYGDGTGYAQYCWDEFGRQILTVKTAFTAQDVEGSDKEIEAGSILFPYGYDPDQKIYYFTYSDMTYTVNYEAGEDGYGLSIDGVSENDLFEGLSYAG